MSPSSPGARRRSAPGRPEPELAEIAKAWAESTAQAQGLSECITDEAVIAQVAVLLGSGRQLVSSGAPDRLDAPRVELVSSPEGGRDDDPGENSGDDRSLPGGVEIRPLRSKDTGTPDESVQRRGA